MKFTERMRGGSRMKNTKRLIFISFMTFLTSCTPTRIWMSQPTYQTLENEYYRAKFEPVKHDKNFFDSFRIVITNKSDKEMKIDWNKTRYILNGRVYDIFVFEGVTTENVHDLPSDTVPAGGTLTKEISPLNLVGWKPLKHRDMGDPNFTSGPLPEGENGIYLNVRQNGKEVKQKITLNIEIKKE